MSRKYIEFGAYKRWAGSDGSLVDDQLAGVYCEELVAPPEQRINPYWLRSVNGRVDFEFDPWEEFADMEERGMRNMFGLARDGYKLIFWFSPPGGHYRDGRVVVARVVRVDGDNIELECRGLVVLESQEKMMTMFENIVREGGVTMDGVNEVEDMRSQPVGINLEGGENWIDFGERVMGMREVWEVVRQGNDVRNKEKIKQIAGEVWREVRRRGGDERMFEMMMMGFGYRLNAVGNHGGSSLMGSGGMFERLFGIVEVGLRVDKVNGKIVCPCGEVLREGVTRCPKCGLKLVVN